MKAVICMAVALLLTSGCATSVYTKVNAFKASDAALGSGTIAVRAAEETMAGSLEFAHYRAQTEHALANLGYTPVGIDQPHTYRALLNFGVENAEVERRGSRVGGITRVYPSFGLHYGLGYGSRFGYGSGLGVVVVDDGIEPGFLQQLSLVIENAESGQRLYEVTGMSQNRCGVMSVVFDEMLAAILTDFPAADGAVRTVAVKGDTKC